MAAGAANVGIDEIVRWLSLELGSRLLSEWGAFQLLAGVVASGWFFVRTPPHLRRLRACLVAAWPGALLGAFLLHPLLCAVGWLLAGGRGAPPRPAGIAAYGALAGLVASYAALARRCGVRPGRALDLLAPSLGILVAFARVGCFRAGCDFGAPTSLPWAVHYPQMTPAFARHRDAGWIAADASRSLAVHPTQLYEAALGLSMAAVALLVIRTQDQRAALRPGSAFAAVALVYASGRGLIDLFRGDVERSGSAATSAQWLGLVVLALVVLWAARASPRPVPPSCPRAIARTPSSADPA